MTTSSSTLVLIGWDDILCRPIYRRHPSQTKPTTKLNRKQTTTQRKCKAHPTAREGFQIEGPQFMSRNKNDDHKRSANQEHANASKSRRQRTRETSVYPTLKKGLGTPASNATLDFPTEFTPEVYDVDDISRDKNANIGFHSDKSTFNQETTDLLSNSVGNENGRFSVKNETDSITSPRTMVDRDTIDPNTAFAAGRCGPIVNSHTPQFNFGLPVNSNHSNGPDKYGTSDAFAYKTPNRSEEKGRSESSRTKVEDYCDPPNSRLSHKVFSSPFNAAASVILDHTPRREVESNIWTVCNNSPIRREKTKDEISISVELQEFQSPMLLECDRRNAESSDIETDDISFFGDFDPDEISLGDNRRVYGRSNMPNWVSKGSNTRKSNESASEQPQLVGWDDIKCRPIYHILQPKPAREEVESSSDEVANTSCLGEEVKSQNRPQKKRVYASIFRMSRPYKAARHNMDMDSPPSPVARRFTLENVVQDCNANRLFDATNDQEDKCEFDFVVDLESNNSHSNRGQLVGEEENSAKSETKIGTRIQPTSTSTIESARAFFRYLDSNHRLTIISTGGETNGKRITPPVIRTTRRIRHCDQLQHEYDAYSKMADATEIDPISIEEFARHWNMHFTERGIIRDGLLDED
ncbi:hypothetical protein HJC23_010186 [Cyclotella cryptica]|uniref:Uncharacterized protein n=1 Tax=Cyclotella cryptica TaxID=29204 RepID=A0ABD3PIP2_9STRA|eukprot:CCRYP_014707-RA/>CCRYP_014707-RA protein AED:0.38 eAED:0.38 QI:0/-1/0/1/-1/1/1/0/637